MAKFSISEAAGFGNVSYATYTSAVKSGKSVKANYASKLIQFLSTL
ncbi:hypothetical protein HMPREF0201_00164 [Cedecea davisae DSM 4568]|uniref:Uncharacterized protein n=1 Tax=Cedecea davisae DSM 4568 TaxID=566551 RepID=S3J3L8_9ENTR|nr:hypothetical protein HMPREF0201_00164 [Cedecea davisae DSM 4568]